MSFESRKEVSLFSYHHLQNTGMNTKDYSLLEYGFSGADEIFESNLRIEKTNTSNPEETAVERQEYRMNRNDEKFTISWKNVSLYAKVKQKSFFKKSDYPFTKLVDNVSGVIESGNLVVIMGPSGAGKSTLMAALAHRNPENIFKEGEILYNGRPITKGLHSISGFMHQDDLFVESLTVREHLEFMGKLKLGQQKSGKEICKIVDKFMVRLNLTKCANTIIGKPGEEKGISGGERKMLSFATEALTRPPILFCDEPTTGLDSFSAMLIIKLMKEMSSRGKLVVCTIHQPSSEFFAMFQQIILLAEGRMAFTGDRESAVKFFDEHGFPCPPNHNPAEIIINALSAKSVHGMGSLQVKKLCDDFSVSQERMKIEERILQIAESSLHSEIMNKKTNERNIFENLKKTYWLMQRSFLQVLRDPSVQTIRLIQKIGIALMASLCFHGVINLNQAGVQSVQGAIFVLVTENSFPPMYGILPIFAEEFPLFLREVSNDLYSPLVYYFAKIVSLTPGLIIEPIIFVSVAYFITGLKNTIYAFFMTNVIAILTTNVAASCGCLFSNAFDDISISLAFLVPLDYTLLATSGLFMKLSTMPSVISWFRYLSWFLYSNEALSIIQWENVHNITCEFNSTEIPCLVSGQEVLKKYDFSSKHLYYNLAVMATTYAVFNVLAYFLLLWKVSRHL